MHLPSPSHVISLFTHSSTVSLRFVASISAKCSSSSSIPSDFTPRRHSILSRDAALNAHRKHTETNIEEAPTSSRSDISCNLRACVCHDFALHASTAHIFSLSTCSRANFTCILIRCTFRTGRIYPRSWLSRPELQRIIDVCVRNHRDRKCAMCCERCSFRESPVVFCTRRDTDSYNRAILRT